MHVIYESFDAMIRYGVLNADDQQVWASRLNNDGGQGTSRPASAEDESTTPLGYTSSRVINAHADIDFYGSSCKVIGWILDVNVTVEVDGKRVPFTPPVDTDDPLFTLDNQSVGWHTLRFISSAVLKAVPYLTITRAIIDTGIPETYAQDKTFNVSANEWTTQGDWERKTVGDAPSLFTRSVNARATFSNEIAESNWVFLYGIVDSGSGKFDVSWLEADANALGGEPPTERSSWNSVYMENRLLFMGVVPKGGVKGLVITKTDNKTNDDAVLPSVQFTRLEVWSSTGQVETTDGSSPSSTDGSLSNTAAPTSPLTQTSSSSASPAMIGGIVSGLIGLLAIFGTLAFLIRRRRQHSSKRLSTANSSVSGDISLRPFIAEAAITTTQPPRPTPRHNVTEKQQVALVSSAGEKGGPSIEQEDQEEAGPSTGWLRFTGWATSSAPPASTYDPDTQSLSAATSATGRPIESGSARRSSVGPTEVPLEAPPTYEETAPNR